MRYRTLLIVVFIALMATGSAFAQWDNQPSWQDRQDQRRLEDLENERRELEYQNRRLRALRAQERSAREMKRNWPDSPNLYKPRLYKPPTYR